MDQYNQLKLSLVSSENGDINYEDLIIKEEQEQRKAMTACHYIMMKKIVPQISSCRKYMGISFLLLGT